MDNNTLTLITPSGPEEQTVNLTLIGTRGQELELQDAYTFDTIAVDSDGDGYLDNTDDCPSLAGIPQMTELVVLTATEMVTPTQMKPGL